MYYLLINSTQEGPFELSQLMEKWRDRQIGPLTLYWEQGNADWLPLHNIAPLLEIPMRGEASGAPPIPPPVAPPPVPVMPPPVPVMPAPVPVMPTPVRVVPAPVRASVEPAAEEEILWSRHPSFWHWAGTITWGLILSLIVIGIPILIYVVIARNSMRYKVTRTRVSIEGGVFTRVSRELRIADIRAIAARANIFGIGDIEFSTAARDDAEVAFHSVTRVEEVRDLVKQLQS